MRAEIVFDAPQRMSLPVSYNSLVQSMIYATLGEYGARLHHASPEVLPAPPGNGSARPNGLLRAASAAPTAGCSALAALAEAQAEAEPSAGAGRRDATHQSETPPAEDGESAGKPFKFFTFSRLEFDNGYERRGGRIIYRGGHFRLQVASALEEFTARLPEGLFGTGGAMELGRQPVEPVDFRLLPAPALAADPPERLTIKTLSPITTRTTFRGSDGAPTDHYYEPADRQFERQLISNLVEKARRLYGEEALPSREQLSPARVRPHKGGTSLRRVRFKGTRIDAYSGLYEVVLPEPLLAAAYDCGLGERNSMGFGMFEPARKTGRSGGAKEAKNKC